MYVGFKLTFLWGVAIVATVALAGYGAYKAADELYKKAKEPPNEKNKS